MVTWNAVYASAVLDQLAQEGTIIADEHLAHLSPAMHEHVNPHGHFDFTALQPLAPGARRPLRAPKERPLDD